VRRLAPALATAAVLAAAAPPAGATIVPQQGMAGVRIGMSAQEVRGVLGVPLRAIRGANDFGPYAELRYPRLVRVLLQGGAVTAISTTGRFERTARGVGVGSTEAAVSAKVRRVRCRTFGSFRECYVGRFLPGKRVTAFLLRGGRVVRVTVGVVVD
jgi:hypothetical protein